MNETDREKIKAHIDELCTLINLSSIVPFVRTKGIFTQPMIDDIMSHSSDKDRLTCLLNDLTRRGPEAYDKFLTVLRETGHEEALDILRRRSRRESMPLHLELGELNVDAGQFKPRHRSSSEMPRIEPRSHSTSQVDATMSKNRIKVTPALRWTRHENSYIMENKPRGYCLLINNVDFDDSGLDTRCGSDTDAKNLDEAFQDLGFEVILKRNLTSSEMKKMAKQVAKKDMFGMNAFVMIVLSHGFKDVVYGCDGMIVDIFDHLVKPFNNQHCSSLIGKPKMFFFQACRGDKKDFGVMIPEEVPRTLPGNSNIRLVSEASGESNILALSKDLPSPLLCAGVPDSFPLPPAMLTANGSTPQQAMSPLKVATWSDILLSYPTVHGYVAFRNPELGSWYCTALVQALAEHSHQWRLIDILSRVDKEVQRMQTYAGDRQATTVQLIGWQNHLYFNPGLYKE